MYCIIGNKILRCEVVEKLAEYSWCKIGKDTKNISIPNRKIFVNEQDARKYIGKREQNKIDKDKEIASEIEKCNELYEDFYKETGISVRLIDRRWKSQEVKGQLKNLRKKKSK